MSSSAASIPTSPPILVHPSVLNKLSEAKGDKIAHFSDFVYWTLIVIQVALFAAHVDGLPGMVHWHPKFATPAAILVAFVFIDSVMSLVALLLPASTVEKAAKYSANDMTTSDSVEDSPGFLILLLSHMRSRMDAVYRLPFGGLDWLASVANSIGAIVAGIFLLLYSSGNFSHSEGFSYTAVMLVAFTGKMIQLVVNFFRFLVTLVQGKHTM